MLQILSRLWNHVLASSDRLRGRYTILFVEELPDVLQARRLYAVGEDGRYWLAALKCPCGCGDIIQLPMIEGQRPRWALAQKGIRLPSLSPSIDRTAGCRSHFWLKQGVIRWSDTRQVIRS
ncbi:DUF6527 family protein [Ralstonia pseudosolanacearum]|uniref:DUF6527 family protein n=1 Tax=Ralstonia pseudosolanacearum TaxID=1310165 RepID=UPI003AAEEF01